MFKKAVSISIIILLIFNINAFANNNKNNILSNQQIKISRELFKEDIRKIFEKKQKEIAVIKEEQKKSLGKILIYHTHTCEKYADGTSVIDAGNDLAEKLKNYGFEVDNICEDFSIDYNNAYNSSRNFLLNTDLSQYKLIIDLHRDSADYRIVRNLNDNDYAVIKFVFSTSNNNYIKQQELANNISNKILDIYSGDFTYEKGILDFNQDLSDNMILIEDGFNSNSIEEVKRSNGKIAKAIAEAFKN